MLRELIQTAGIAKNCRTGETHRKLLWEECVITFVRKATQRSEEGEDRVEANTYREQDGVRSCAEGFPEYLIKKTNGRGEKIEKGIPTIF